ncbi:disulfide bond formation protein B [Conchiformibius kuhniae]|uniref:Disulfide bond formation protein B n=1 Tax=Conchiformibius kuhniae TaxID=211502 RepID=A0A8T9MT51_9NEIS|nr:disulfide bond formation protein B [Conchiformibius kuhniae]UOP04439.1 disulfide bond formation protein B [Conchiformibius kuhniae]
MYRKTVGAVFGISAAGVAASLTAQYVWGMNPCVMCIQQRLALAGMAWVSLLCLALPLGKRWAQTAAAGAVSAPALFGLYIAAKQIHLQSLPLAQQPPCGAPWTFRWRDAPLFDWYEPLIRGTGACGEVYRVLGVPLAWWSAAFFGTALLVLWGAWRYTRRVPMPMSMKDEKGAP